MATPKNRSVIKAFSLLRSFDRPDEWLTSSELSRRARLPEASGYRLVQTLEGIGAVVRDSRGRYRPGMLLLTLSQDIVARELWGRAPQMLLNTLARELGVAVSVGVLEDGMVTYVARAGAPQQGLAIDVGMQFEAYCTALGKVLLASLGDAALEEFLADGELIALTERTIVDVERLRADLVRIRCDDHAVDDRETIDTTACVAAPIRNGAGKVVAALSVSDQADAMTEARVVQLRGAVADAAVAIGSRLFPWQDVAPPPRADAAKVTACGARC